MGRIGLHLCLLYRQVPTVGAIHSGILLIRDIIPTERNKHLHFLRRLVKDVCYRHSTVEPSVADTIEYYSLAPGPSPTQFLDHLHGIL